jgi:DNA-binding LacI/PurR family transcriptional regulator
MFNIRKGTRDEVKGFALYDDANEGEFFLVVENESGEVVGFAQMLDGETVTFMQSEEKGAGRALVDYLKDHGDHIIADSVDSVSAGFWQRMGFEKSGAHNYEWWAE